MVHMAENIIIVIGSAHEVARAQDVHVREGRHAVNVHESGVEHGYADSFSSESVVMQLSPVEAFYLPARNSIVVGCD